MPSKDAEEIQQAIDALLPNQPVEREVMEEVLRTEWKIFPPKRP